IIAAVSIAALGAGFEWYFRHDGQFPRTDINMPMTFAPGVGMTYTPGGTVKWTNGIDFWTETKINSLGFADAEPALPKPKDTFRVAIVGDSFVEALQVPIEQKVQTLLAHSLRERYPERQFDAVALGISGTGQANQLPFYERSRGPLAPAVVVLVFVNNDFANNSFLLEGPRYGFAPESPPWLYLRPDCSRIEPVATWQQFRIAGTTPSARADTLSSRSPSIAESLSGWNGHQLDGMFYAAKLPPAFEDALASTRCALREWKRL